MVLGKNRIPTSDHTKINKCNFNKRVGDLDCWAVQFTVAGMGSAQEGLEWLRHSDLVSHFDSVVSLLSQ